MRFLFEGLYILLLACYMCHGADNRNIISDNTSLVFTDPNASIQLEPESSISVKGQSVIHALSKAKAHLQKESILLVAQTGHVVLGDSLTLEEGAAISVDASRLQMKGPVRMGNSSWLQMFDNSLFRVNEGGQFSVGAETHMEMYRGARMQISERTWNAKEDTSAHASFGERLTMELYGQSNLKVARGGLMVKNDVRIVQSPQSKFSVNGQMNVSDSSRIKLGTQSLLQVGVGDDEPYDAPTAPTFIFSKNNLELAIDDRFLVKVSPNSHCMLTKSIVIKENVVLTSGSIDMPYVRCFGNVIDLKAAIGIA